MRRRNVLLAVTAVGLVGLAAALVTSLGPPDRVWCRLDPGGGTHEFRDMPDGREVAHAATMSARDAEWAYYYLVPGWRLRLSEWLSSRHAITVDFVATGRETTTASGRWVEMRRCDEAELSAAIARSAGR
jgi:hypothetical protein